MKSNRKNSNRIAVIFCGSNLFFSSFLRNLFPANLVAAAFRSVSASTSLHHTTLSSFFSSNSPFISTFCLFSLTTCVLGGLFIRIYFTNHADATPHSFTVAVNPGCNAEGLIMPLNEETFRIETSALPCLPKCLFSWSLTSRYHGETIPFQLA